MGSKPFSSAVVPKVSLPPFLGLAVEMPLACFPLELWAASARPPSSPPVAPATVSPAATAVPRARNERRSIGFDMVPLVRTAVTLTWSVLSDSLPTPGRPW